MARSHSCTWYRHWDRLTSSQLQARQYWEMENSKYTVSLGMPAGRARLNEFSMVAMVTILENDDPYKVFEIVTMDG